MTEQPPQGTSMVYCFACGTPIDARAEICPKCGVRQRHAAPAPAGGKDRVAAIALALLLGGLGIHKFYLGKTTQGVLYLLFSWTGIPSLIAWVEGILFLRTSDEEWAAIYGGPTQQPNSVTLGCLWLIAIGPVIGLVAFLGLISVGSQFNIGT